MALQYRSGTEGWTQVYRTTVGRQTPFKFFSMTSVTFMPLSGPD